MLIKIKNLLSHLIIYFLKERKKPDLVFHQISKDVNKPTNNTVSLIQKV